MSFNGIPRYMAKALGIETRNLSDRKLWELLRARSADTAASEAVRRELLARGQLVPDRVFHAPRRHPPWLHAVTETSPYRHAPSMFPADPAVMELSDRKLLAGIQKLDLLTFGWCHARRRIGVLAAGARRVSRSADGWLYLLFPLLYSLMYGADAKAFVSLAALAFALERAVYAVLKNTCRRRRPPDFIPDFRSFVTPGDTFSFPSGHTSAAFLFAGLCAGEFGLWAAMLLYPWAALGGVSRVLLGVHFPSDIVAGALLGSGLLLASQNLLTAAAL